jgi:hypothetical protein
MTTIRAALVVLILSSLTAIDARPTAGEIYRPWCAPTIPPDGTNCGFTSYEQCMMTARGAGANCVQNPWYPRYGSGQNTGRGERPSGRQSVADIVKIHPRRVGLDPALLGGHSVRAGFLTSAAKAWRQYLQNDGREPPRIGRYAARYVEDAELFQDHVSAGLL